jgi:hypothetical protein
MAIDQARLSDCKNNTSQRLVKRHTSYLSPLLTGGLLVRIQPEEPNRLKSVTYGHETSSIFPRE